MSRAAGVEDASLYKRVLAPARVTSSTVACVARLYEAPHFNTIISCTSIHHNTHLAITLAAFCTSQVHAVPNLKAHTIGIANKSGHVRKQCTFVLF